MGDIDFILRQTRPEWFNKDGSLRELHEIPDFNYPGSGVGAGKKPYRDTKPGGGSSPFASEYKPFPQFGTTKTTPPPKE